MRKNVLCLSIAAMIGGFGLVSGASAGVYSEVADQIGGTTATTPVTATQLVLDNTGVGHNLVLPYFNTQNGNATTINIVNTDNVNGKLLKLRFRGASNSDDLLDFQVFLSPSDVWTASLSANPTTGVTQLATSDNTCTLPAAITAAVVPFGTGRLNQSLTGDTLASETREGYLEVLNSADIPPKGLAGQGASAATSAANPLFTAIKHISGVPPCTTGPINGTLVDPLRAVSVTAFSGGAPSPTELAASTMGLVAPTGLIFANSIIINVPNTTTFPSEAIALRAVAVVPPTATNPSGLVNASANLTHFPQLNQPMFTTGVALSGVGIQSPADAATADPLFKALQSSVKQAGGGGVQDVAGVPVMAINYLDLPDLSTPYLLLAANPTTANSPYLAPSQAAVTTRALATVSVNNEILGSSSIGAKTDWVFSMPTRRYSVAQNYGWSSATGGADGRVFTNYESAVTPGNAGQFPYFSTTNTVVGGLNNNQICVKNIGVSSYDRSETGVGYATNSASFSPPSAAAAGLIWCGETNVLSFNAGSNTSSSVLGAKVARQNINTTTGLDGWVSLSTPAPLLQMVGSASPAVNYAGLPAVPVVGRGLPVVGSAYMQATNAAATAGTSGTYGARFLHRFTR